MRTKLLVVILAIFISIPIAAFLVLNSNPGEPPSLRVSLLNSTLFIRWTSKEYTVGYAYVGSAEYRENVPRELHKISVPYSPDIEKIRIVERSEGKAVANYCIKMDEVKYEPIYVGLYTDTGADDESYGSLERMLEAMNFTVRHLRSGDFTSAYKLEFYDFIAFPGGRADFMINTLGKSAIMNVRKYVEMGGGYFGICAGAYLASNFTVWHGVEYGDSDGYYMDLYYGKAIGPIKEIGNYDTNAIYNSRHPTNVTWMDGTKMNVTYWGGPYFSPTDNVRVLATYDKVGKPAAIDFSFQGGRVALFGFHPEIDTRYSEINTETIREKCYGEFLWVAGITF